jgi:hypothetical protein
MAWSGSALGLHVSRVGATEPSGVQVALAWDPNPEPDVESYVVHYGLRPGVYFRHVPVGNVTNTTLDLPLPAASYYLALSALDMEGLESDYSSEIVYDAPTSDTPLLSVPRKSEGIEDRDLILDFGEGAWDGGADWTVLIPPSQGSLEQRGTNVVYVPHPHATGLDVFEIVGNLNASIPPVKWVWEVEVLPENDPPVAVDQEWSTENLAPIDILLEGQDYEGDQLFFEIAVPPKQGFLTGIPPSVTYTPNGMAEGTDSFSYRVSDGNSFSEPAFVFIELVPASAPPLVTDQVLDVLEDQPLSFQLALLDRPDLFIRILKNPEFGTLTGAPPNLFYRPEPNFFGSDSISVEVSDPNGLTNIAVVYFDVVPVNDPPVAISASVETSAGVSVELPLLGEDVDHDELLFEIADPPRKGTVTGDPPRLLYQPHPGESGPDSLTFRAYDGESLSGLATISIHIQPAPAPLRVQALLDPAGNVVLRWNSTPGQRYRVLYREQLHQENWLPASDEILATSITVRWNGAALPGNSTVFYAVEALDP